MRTDEKRTFYNEFLPLPLVKDKTILFFSVRMLAGRKFSVASGKVEIENLNPGQ